MFTRGKKCRGCKLLALCVPMGRKRLFDESIIRCRDCGRLYFKTAGFRGPNYEWDPEHEVEIELPCVSKRTWKLSFGVLTGAGDYEFSLIWCHKCGGVHKADGL